LYLGTASGAVLVFDTLHFRLSNHSLPAVPAKPQEHPTNQNNVKSHFHIPDFSLGVEAFYDSVSSLCSVSDDTLIVGYSSGTVHAFNMSTRKPKQVWHVVDFTVTALCSTPEGCVAGFADGTIAVLNLNSNRPVFSGKCTSIMLFLCNCCCINALMS
jgi:WD40 repeat protein